MISTINFIIEPAFIQFCDGHILIWSDGDTTKDEDVTIEIADIKEMIRVYEDHQAKKVTP